MALSVDTHAHTHMHTYILGGLKLISRNQALAGLWLVCTPGLKITINPMKLLNCIDYYNIDSQYFRCLTTHNSIGILSYTQVYVDAHMQVE